MAHLSPFTVKNSYTGPDFVISDLRRFARAIALLGLPGLGSACATLGPSEASLPLGSVQIAAPPVYAEWAQRTRSCSGMERSLSTVQFYVVPGVQTFPTKDGAKVGLWSREGKTDRIVIAGNYENHEMVVRHEMLHALLQREGHPADYFVNRCHLTWETWSANGGN
jgi:hypothetical protein